MKYIKDKNLVKLLLIVLLLCIFLFIRLSKKKNYIDGVVLKKIENVITIQSEDDSKFTITMEEIKDKNVKVGDIVRVEYIGEILETSPARINHVKNIHIIK
ncbi:MAG TPA: hypothetical protein IAC41_04565 [Candidatus Merdenecus merdavium]|nr:hypothetical protein [Candidatus Merdenecus merdavium]